MNSEFQDCLISLSVLTNLLFREPGSRGTMPGPVGTVRVPAGRSIVQVGHLRGLCYAWQSNAPAPRSG
ncbi:MAG TPA: hypothetical protein VLA49_15160 [Anaerolineales bacterium]|nr:hypothetical protein [Anaerolineales bacterium]